jgi:hypothetical protein
MTVPWAPFFCIPLPAQRVEGQERAFKLAVVLTLSPTTNLFAWGGGGGGGIGVGEGGGGGGGSVGEVTLRVKEVVWVIVPPAAVTVTR